MPGDRTLGDRLQVLELTRQGKLSVDDIVTAASPVEEAPSACFRRRDHLDQLNTIVYQRREG